MAITPGMSGRYEVVVGPEHLGTASGFDDLPILTEPWLTLFCEMAGHHAVVPGFEPGQASVGVHVDLAQLRPIGPGRALTVEATVIAVEGRRVRMAVEGFDRSRPFVRGTHDRVVVDLERFLTRLPRRR